MHAKMASKQGKVLIAAPVHPVLKDGLTDMGYECVPQIKITQAEAYGLLKDCVGVITSTRLQLDKALLDAAPLLRWIGRMGSGMEVVDVPYAQGKGIACYSSPEGNCNAVAEHALGMLLTLIRRIAWSGQEVARGMWKREENRGTELEGKTIGIIGFGHTGAAFAKKLQGFDMQIMAYDKYRTEEMPAYVTRCADVVRIQDEADIVSFHVPLQPDTVNYLDEGFISKMRKPFIVINTSRGKVADTYAIKNGLDGGKIIGACLDVLEQEPMDAMQPGLRELVTGMAVLPQVVLTPHIAGYTEEALYKMSKVLLQKINSAI
jgi:D-3-phosphoglycerate dehydrogenase